MKKPLFEYYGLIPLADGGSETSSSANDGSLWVPLGQGDKLLDRHSGGIMKLPLLLSEADGEEKDEPNEAP